MINWQTVKPSCRPHHYCWAHRWCRRCLRRPEPLPPALRTAGWFCGTPRRPGPLSALYAWPASDRRRKKTSCLNTMTMSFFKVFWSNMQRITWTFNNIPAWIHCSDSVELQQRTAVVKQTASAEVHIKPLSSSGFIFCSAQLSHQVLNTPPERKDFKLHHKTKEETNGWNGLTIRATIWNRMSQWQPVRTNEVNV